MDIKTSFKANWAVLVPFLSVFLIYSCNGEDTLRKPLDLKEFPPLLKAIKTNNEKIPSFYGKFSVSSRTEGKTLNADGEVYLDKIGKRIKILLIDTLTRDTVLDLVKVGDKVQLYLNSDDRGVIIEGEFEHFRLDKYISDFKMNLKDLLHLVSGESYLFKEFDEILQKEDSEFFYYQITQKNKTEILSISKENKKIEKMLFLENNKFVFKINYQKYGQEKGFYYPIRSDFFRDEIGNEKNIFYLSEVYFSYNFNSKQFQLNNYPTAKRIRDSAVY